LTPAGAVVRPVTSRGSELIRPVVIDNQVVFVQRLARKLRQVTYDLNSDDFIARDISILSEHITQTGLKQLAYQQDPDSIVWCVRNDGELIGFTIESEQNVVGAHRHRIGGTWLTEKAAVQSVATIEDPEGKQDQLWLVGVRTINGSTKQYIEFMEDSYRPEVTVASTDLELIQALEGAFFVDSGLSLDNPTDISGITQANPGVVTTASAHGLTTGDTVRLRDIRGMTALNLRSFTVTVLTSTTFELDGEDTGNYGAYVYGGTVRKEEMSISGLNHLEGEEVRVLVDGGPHPNRTVSDGSISLARKGSIIHIGLPFTWLGETQRFVGGGRLGSDQGQKARIQRVTLRVHNTVGLLVGTGPSPSDEGLEQILFRDGGDVMDRPPPLFTGDKEVPVAGGWTREPTIYFEKDDALPGTILAIMPRAESNER
jgi:hypothetical protein